jgi:hypothetical protein
MKTTHGRIHGRTIELDADLGLADGQEVEVRVQPLSRAEQWGEGLRRCAGALAQEWSEEDDRILDAIQQERKRDTRREIPQ